MMMPIYYWKRCEAEVVHTCKVRLSAKLVGLASIVRSSEQGIRIL